MRTCTFPERIIQLHKVEPTAEERQLIALLAKPVRELKNKFSQIGILQSLTSSPHALRARLQAEALAVMTERAGFMARQPGFVSISVHRSLDGRRIVNYIQWENRDLLHAAHKSPEFRKEWSRFDKLTDDIDPHLYEVVHVMDQQH